MKKLLLLLCLVGCGTSDAIKNAEEVRGIEYYKDARTNLCFARNTYYDTHSEVFVNIPCTPEVERLIK